MVSDDLTSYWAKSARNFDKQSSPDIDDLVKRICREVGRVKRVLGVAVGTGIVSLAIARQAGQVDALDLEPEMIADSDAGMIEAALQRTEINDGFYLLLSSPGGDGLAAERIVNICRSYAGDSGFSVIVPNQAKSAATMVCFGAKAIVMSSTSELGPVDPQLTMKEDGRLKRFSVCNLVEGYRELFDQAVKTKGNLEPFVQQLNHYDAREIKEFEDAIQLSSDISILSLQSGMIKGVTKKDIEKKLAIFLSPKAKKSHGRPIYHEEAVKCFLNIDLLDIRSDVWESITELHLRLDSYVTKHAAKCVETAEQSFSMPPVSN